MGMPVPLMLEKQLATMRRPGEPVHKTKAKKKRSPKRHRDKFYQTREWKNVRYDVLTERGARCECCGVSPREGAVMNVDHIVPVSRAWDRRLDKNNLQILCASCNQGKGARRADDWRQEQPQVAA